MKSSKQSPKEKISRIIPCECGSTQFVSEPVGFDIYEIIDGRLEEIGSDSYDFAEGVYCRNCYKEHDYSPSL